MKKKMLIVVVATVCLVMVMAIAPVFAAKPSCTTIQDGVLTYSAGHYLEGEPLMVGYDPYGYNYQAHMFNGYYANSYLGKDGFPPYEGDAEAYLAENPDAENTWYWQYRDVWLMMKWNDAWLSNKDCNDDGKLDRPDDFNSYIGSGAWVTNHQSGTDEDGHWTYFVKIVAQGYEGHAEFIGAPEIWGAFMVIQRVSQGQYLLVPPAGFGYYK